MSDIDSDPDSRIDAIRINSEARNYAGNPYVGCLTLIVKEWSDPFTPGSHLLSQNPGNHESLLTIIITPTV